MKSYVILAVLAAALTTVGCTDTQKYGVGGAAVGAGAGAIIGNNSSVGSGTGAVLGGAIGGLGGAAYGQHSETEKLKEQQRQQEERRYYDQQQNQQNQQQWQKQY